ncbi:hypothetical protein BKA82DRAFT_22420 [Pisolithus tinctorius]|uniref:CS domain-containing protein n=1 Tax=Pisolithus tinctorius Marx 270 TaxID=870435 RepID=A0A0C3JJF6_PISTI|nr:hypothetical protein BKA82DRAFT_22420 [Pisolithus tinctorius]KIO09243.1 hypothetical protein M404DRAFT_22420 [Pisolithus tinctorius Marx 270]
MPIGIGKRQNQSLETGRSAASVDSSAVKTADPDEAASHLQQCQSTPWREPTVVIERSYLLAGVKGQQPVVKGRLYGNVDVANSAWQLEPRTSRPSTRERTTSTLSTASTQSSYAFVSDPEISSSFAASLESAQASDAEEPVTPSPALSSPTSSAEEQPGYHRRVAAPAVSGHVSPVMQPHALSSFSSLESFHSSSGRLLTLHLEKDQSVIWPSLIVGAVPQELFPSPPIPMLYDPDLEVKYNMDPTSLVLFAIELLDIRKDKEEAFECFVRAWHQAHLPSATMKLVTHYLPPHTSLSLVKEAEENTRGTLSYYVQCIGGAAGLGQLYLEAGLLHLEGAASVVLSASYATLSSIRVPPHPQPENGAEAWKRDRDAAGRYFDRARAMNPDLDIPVISDERSGHTELEMPSLEIHHHSAPESAYSGEGSMYSEQERVVRRRRQERTKDELIFIDNVKGKDDIDNAWYLYVPSLVGAGTALLVVGVIGALSFSSWRRNQGS